MTTTLYRVLRNEIAEALQNRNRSDLIDRMRALDDDTIAEAERRMVDWVEGHLDKDAATRNPDPPSPRFKIYVHGHDRDDAAEWRCKLLLVDRAWLDPEGFPVDAVAAGESWSVAFRTAVEFMTSATHAKDCVFY